MFAQAMGARCGGRGLRTWAARCRFGLIPESALVDGNRVLATPGGKEGAIVAFDKTNGKLLWQAKDVPEIAHYASIIRHEFNGQPQYVHVMEKRFVGLSPETGKLLWESPFPGRTAVIPTPIAKGNRVFATAGYGIGCVAVDVG